MNRRLKDGPFYLVKGCMLYWIRVSSSNICDSYPIFVILFLRDCRLLGHDRNDFWFSVVKGQELLCFMHLLTKKLFCSDVFFLKKNFFKKQRSLPGRLTISHSSLCSLYANLSSTWFRKSCTFRGLDRLS